MDKTKIGAIAALVGLAGLLLFSRAQEAPAPDPEGDEAQSTAAPAKSNVDLAGGVTALKIEDLKVGTGAAAQSGNNLSMNYKGSLLSGEVFDQSYGKAPFDFQLGAGRVIKGWDKGIVGMKEGGKRKLTIPASLGYGENGSGKIPGGATLVFEVELLKVSK
ncbi:MAG TPA: FKBP-type peptidyl-prolyl cis-trans isomerase [Abditibacterium sp.]|jgi:FKBP-type peptidyl-prolyl cis-trans isomerase